MKIKLFHVVMGSSSTDSSSNDSTFYDEEDCDSSSLLLQSMLISSEGEPLADMIHDVSESLKMISKHLCNQNRILIKIGTLLDVDDDDDDE
jgi:hypothetical protein